MIINNLPKIILAALILLAACGKQEVDKKTQLENLKKQQEEISAQIITLEKELGKDEGAEKDKVKTVIVEPVELKTFNHFVEIQGKVDTDKNVVVSAETAGNITRVYVKRGDKVRRGQTLAELDATIVRKSIDELKTSLELANNIYEKQDKLWKENIGTEVQYLQAKNTKDNLENKLSQLNEQLKKAKITASMDGVIDDVYKKEGEIMSPGIPAFRLVNLSEFKIMGELAESYVSKVNEGDEVTINFPDLNKEISAKISVVGSTINSTNRTFGVEIRLPQGKVGFIKPNMICYLKIKDFTKNKAVVVPINTVQNSSTGSYVYVAKGNKVEKRVVKSDYTYGNFALITDGLNVGDKLITFGYSDLAEGELIKY